MKNVKKYKTRRENKKLQSKRNELNTNHKISLGKVKKNL